MSETTNAAIGATKESLRREALARRARLDPVARIERSLAIAAHFDALAVEAGSVVAGFMPIRSEIDPRPLMDALREAGAKLCLPVTRKEEALVFRRFARDDALVAGPYGTLCPPDGAEVAIPDLILAPLAAFDRFGGRIGYGGGYYDRTMEALRLAGRRPRLVGLAFDIQQVDRIPTENHDIALDGVLTESGLRAFTDRG